MENFFRFEKKGEDFPFYNDEPHALSGRSWITLLLFPFLGFLYLTNVYVSFLSPYVNELFSGCVLLASSFLGLRLAVGKNWKVLFRPLCRKDVLRVAAYVLGAMVVAGLIGGLLELFGSGLNDNPMTTKASDPGAFTTYFSMRFQELFQLFGEEFLAILPFLAILHVATEMFGIQRKRGVIIAWICSSIVFGMLHLPTYDWNVLQCVLVIGGSRMMLTFPYIQTKNVWLSYFVHYFYDMLVFTIAFFS